MDIEKLKPIGVILVLGFTVLMILTCVTVDMGVPERYEPEHDTEYYLQNTGTMEELEEEMRENVLPNLQGVTEIRVDGTQMKIVVVIEAEYYDRMKAVLLRDFGENLLVFEKGEPA